MHTQPDLALLMRTLADPTRRGVFERIASAGEAAAGALTGGAAVSQPAVSQHLRALREAGLVSERREGRNVYYRATPEGLAPLIDWLGFYGGFWRERMARLETLLKEIDDDRDAGKNAGHKGHRPRKRAAPRA